MTAHVPLLSVREVDPFDPRDVAPVEAWLDGRPEATLFHRPQWLRMVERGCGQRARLLLAERNGRPVGCLPLAEIRSAFFGHALVSAGFGTGGGIIAEGEGATECLARTAWSIARARGVRTVELRGGPVPTGWTGLAGRYSRFERPLTPGEDLLASIPRKPRAEVRRGMKAGLEVSIGQDARHLRAFFRVYSESVRNLGTPVFPRRLFEAALQSFADDAEILALWRGQEPVAAFLNFHHRDRLHAYWGGGTREARALKANDLIYFEMMKRASALGCTVADFGRSKVGTGAWKRKIFWGMEEIPIVHAVTTTAGEEAREINPLDPRFRRRVAAWQKLPLWLANRIGPILARGLG